MKIKTVINENDGQEYVSIENEDGSQISMLKSVWEAQQEASGTLS